MRPPSDYRLSLIVAVLILSLPVQALAAGPPITALAFDPGGSELLVGSQNGVQRYSWPDLKAGERLESDLPQVHDIAFSPDGTWLAIAGGTPGASGRLEVWSWPIRQKLAAYDLHSDVIYQLAWSADGKRLFTASHDGGVFEVDPQSGKTLRQFMGHSEPVRSVCFLEDHQTLVTAGNDQTIRVWDTKSGQLLKSLHNHTKAVYALAPKPKTNESELPVMASIGADGTVRLWQPTIGRMMRFRRLDAAIPLALAWSPDGQELIVADDKGVLQIMDPQTLEGRRALSTEAALPYSLLITPDGKTAVLGGKDSALQAIPLGEGSG